MCPPYIKAPEATHDAHVRCLQRSISYFLLYRIVLVKQPTCIVVGSCNCIPSLQKLG